MDDLKSENFYLAGISLSLLNILICFLRVGEIYEVISEYGADNRVALLFNILLLVSGILVTLGSVLISKKHLKSYGRFATIVLLMSSASLIFLALFPLGISQQIRFVHWTFSAIFFFGFSISMIIFGIIFRHTKTNISIILVVMGIVNILQLIVLYPNRAKLLAQVISIVLTIIFIFILTQVSPKLTDKIEDNGDF